MVQIPIGAAGFSVFQYGQTGCGGAQSCNQPVGNGLATFLTENRLVREVNHLSPSSAVLQYEGKYEGWNFNFGNTPLDWIQELLE